MGIFILFNYSHSTSPLSSSVNKTTTVNVLIYDGTGTMETSVTGIENCLNEMNNLSTKKHFSYSTTEKINSDELSGYDVLIIPGGDASEYLENSEIDSNAIKQFVSNGKGYLGICAGAYAASEYVNYYYSGWGLEPDVVANNVNYEGDISISTTTFGQQIINDSQTTIFHENGPALYTNDTQNIISTFADNNTGYEGYADMIGESYGSGRVLLSGSHPELAPENPELLANMILWLAKNLD